MTAGGSGPFVVCSPYSLSSGLLLMLVIMCVRCVLVSFLALTVSLPLSLLTSFPSSPLVSGADLFSMYVGEGEALLRDTFRLARLSAPSVVFIDEIDGIAGKRCEQRGRGQERRVENVKKGILFEGRYGRRWTGVVTIGWFCHSPV